MKTLKQFVNEIVETTHKDGTYMSVTLDKVSKDKLFSWVKECDITNAADPDQYHATVIYSRKPCPKAITYDMNLPIATTISGFKLFPTQQGTTCLVGIVSSKVLDDHHNKLVNDYGATHDYPDYHPHITLSYDYDREPPANPPDFTLVFDKSEVKALDPSFVPSKAKD